jgi:hypothetical protein
MFASRLTTLTLAVAAITTIRASAVGAQTTPAPSTGEAPAAVVTQQATNPDAETRIRALEDRINLRRHFARRARCLEELLNEILLERAEKRNLLFDGHLATKEFQSQPVTLRRVEYRPQPLHVVDLCANVMELEQSLALVQRQALIDHEHKPVRAMAGNAFEVLLEL